jgi:hypothetical protein
MEVSEVVLLTVELAAMDDTGEYTSFSRCKFLPDIPGTDALFSSDLINDF